MDSETGLFESVTPLEDAISLEVVSTLREWHRIWSRVLYLKRRPTDEELFNKIGATFNELIEWRRQLINGTLTQDQMNEIKLKMAAKIDWGNRLLGLDLVPRVDGQVADAELVSPIELFGIHVRSSEPLQQTSQRHSSSSLNAVQLHFIYLHVREVNLALSNPEDSFEIAFSIIDANVPLSEKFVARLSANQAADAAKLSISTVFELTDINPADVTRDLHLHVQVFRLGKMLLVEGKTKSSSASKGEVNCVKRPYGSAVISLSDVIKGGLERELPVKLAACSNENDTHLLVDWLLRKQTNKLSQLQNSSLSLTLKFLSGSSLTKVSSENPLIFKNVTCMTPVIHPDVILPGSIRNDLYVTLESGEFERERKSKNIEATISLLGMNGSPIKNSVTAGAGVEPVTAYSSVVLYHNNNPRWSETIKVLIPLEVFDVGAHIRIEYRHCSAKESNSSKEKKLLGKKLSKAFIVLVASPTALLLSAVMEIDCNKLNEHVLFVFQASLSFRWPKTKAAPLSAMGLTKSTCTKPATVLTREPNRLTQLSTCVCCMAPVIRDTTCWRARHCCTAARSRYC